MLPNRPARAGQGQTVTSTLESYGARVPGARLCVAIVPESPGEAHDAGSAWGDDVPEFLEHDGRAIQSTARIASGLAWLGGTPAA